MQRLLLLLSTLFALYACAPVQTHKTAAPVRHPAAAKAPSQQPVAQPPAAVTAAISRPALVVASPTAEQATVPQNYAGNAHIALLLPLQSNVFGTAASIVQQGFMAAASLNLNGLPVQAYSNFDENHSLAEVYREAIANGAVAVVGPLTRNGVKSLADVGNFPVPTLSLNILDSVPAHNMYFFGMAIESEARQVANLARQQGKQQAIVITSNDTLARRLQLAFEEQWAASGGTIAREIEFKGDTAVFSSLVAKPGLMVFFATDMDKTRPIRPFLTKELPAYATSQIFAGNEQTLINYDLEGIHFVDMPWLLQADLPAIANYPHAFPPLAADMERFYALGIDAYRLTLLLLNHQEDAALPMLGATGNIRLNNGYLFQHEAMPATFMQGHARTADAPAAPTVVMFPGQELPVEAAASAVPETGGLNTLP
ncbi:MAG: penicillin-binding protein activator [Gallionella sp.]|nr:penicillin-binding protein activator [Gallionella sp.]